MLNLRNLMVSAAMLFWMTALISCASFAIVSPEPLGQRSLELLPDKPAAQYTYWACTKKFLGICTKQELQTDTYDLTDANARKNLIALGYVLTPRPKP